MAAPPVVADFLLPLDPLFFGVYTRDFVGRVCNPVGFDSESSGGTWSNSKGVVPVAAVQTDFTPKRQPNQGLIDFLLRFTLVFANTLKYKPTAFDITSLSDDIDNKLIEIGFANLEIKYMRLRRYHLLCDMLQASMFYVLCIIIFVRSIM